MNRDTNLMGVDSFHATRAWIRKVLSDRTNARIAAALKRYEEAAKRELAALWIDMGGEA